MTAAPPDPGALPFDPTSPRAVRQAARSGILTSQTSGLADGFVQVNLAILPADYATDFLIFCQRNPKPCPLLAMSEVGDPGLPKLGADLDVRTDVPSYRIWREGELAGEVPRRPRSLARRPRRVRDRLLVLVRGCDG